MIEIEDLGPVFEGDGLDILPDQLFVGRVQIGRVAVCALPVCRR